MRPCADGEPAVAVVVVEVVGEALAADVEGEVLALANVGLREFSAIARTRSRGLVGWAWFVVVVPRGVGNADRVGEGEPKEFER